MTNFIKIEKIGHGKPLVLIHGLAWHSGVWNPLIPLLAKNYTLFLVDLPGHGKSRVVPTYYDFPTIAQEIFTQVPEKAEWLGWSLGGLVATWVAIHYPQKVERLITVASTPCFIEKFDWPGISTETLTHFLNDLLNDYDKTINDFLALQLRGSAHMLEKISFLQSILMDAKPPEKKALKSMVNLLLQTDFRSQLASITCPSLHIFGKKDRLVPPTIAPLLNKLSPLGTSIVLQHSAHLPFISEMDNFLKIIVGYLTQFSVFK
jgi:pimeloyl-[acyl-carrier protein] methyl ester esterase